MSTLPLSGSQACALFSQTRPRGTISQRSGGHVSECRHSTGLGTMSGHTMRSYIHVCVATYFASTRESNTCRADGPTRLVLHRMTIPFFPCFGAGEWPTQPNMKIQTAPLFPQPPTSASKLWFYLPASLGGSSSWPSKHSPRSCKILLPPRSRSTTRTPLMQL